MAVCQESEHAQHASYTPHWDYRESLAWGCSLTKARHMGNLNLMPYLFSINNQLRLCLSLGQQIMVLPRLLVSGYYEYQADFGWVNKRDNNRHFAKEFVWRTGAEYLLSRNFSLMASYENRFGSGGGLSVRF